MNVLACEKNGINEKPIATKFVIIQPSIHEPDNDIKNDKIVNTTNYRTEEKASTKKKKSHRQTPRITSKKSKKNPEKQKKPVKNIKTKTKTKDNKKTKKK